MRNTIYGVLAIALFVLFSWMFYEFILFFVEADNDIKAALIGVFGVTVAALFSHYFAQKRGNRIKAFFSKS